MMYNVEESLSLAKEDGNLLYSKELSADTNEIIALVINRTDFFLSYMYHSQRPNFNTICMCRL